VVRLQSEPIRPEELLARVASGADGALALFVGTVRANNRGRRVLWLEYEAYAAMAEAEMARLVGEAERRFAVSAVALVHRTGRLEVGEASVAIAVAAEHRAPALEACRFVIESLKRTVPIWKKEVFEGGEVWIEGTGEGGGAAPASHDQA
jgi:molybdopterin synthase catalytic subunit